MEVAYEHCYGYRTARESNQGLCSARIAPKLGQWEDLGGPCPSDMFNRGGAADGDSRCYIILAAVDGLSRVCHDIWRLPHVGTAVGEFLLKITLAGICSENQDRESSGMMAAQYESHVTVWRKAVVRCIS